MAGRLAVSTTFGLRQATEDPRFSKAVCQCLAVKQPSQRRRDVLKATLYVSGCLELVLGEQLRQGLSRFAKTRSRRVIGQAMHPTCQLIKS
jgi:hypothetical protein